MSVLFSLKDKKVLIIGGSYGMGLATAEAVLEAGGQVAIAARNPVTLAAAAQSLEAKSGVKVPYTALSIEDRAAVKAAAAKVIAPVRSASAMAGFICDRMWSVAGCLDVGERP